MRTITALAAKSLGKFLAKNFRSTRKFLRSACQVSWSSGLVDLTYFRL